MSIEYNPANKPLPGHLPDLSHPLCRGLVGWWMFSERAGGLLHDLVHPGKSGNHGTWSGSGDHWAGGAGQFDGSTDYIALGNTGLLGTNTAVALSAWVYPRADEFSVILGDGDLNLRFGTYSSPSLSWITYIDGDYELSPSIFELNKWQNFVIVFAIRGSNWTLEYYKDGQYKGNDVVGQDLGSSLTNLVFGVDPRDYSGYEFNGLISEIALCDKAKGAQEINARYNDRISGKYVEFPKLDVSYFYPAEGPVISMPLVMLQHNHFDGGAFQ